MLSTYREQIARAPMPGSKGWTWWTCGQSSIGREGRVNVVISVILVDTGVLDDGLAQGVLEPGNSTK